MDVLKKTFNIGDGCLMETLLFRNQNKIFLKVNAFLGHYNKQDKVVMLDNRI